MQIIARRAVAISLLAGTGLLTAVLGQPLVAQEVQSDGALQPPRDDLSYLESQSHEATAWVKSHNDRTRAFLQHGPDFEWNLSQALDLVESTQAVGDYWSKPQIIGTDVYRFQPGGQRQAARWERASLKSYGSPATVWRTVIDINALNLRERKNWSIGRAEVSPNGQRAMLYMVEGNSTVVEWREFNLITGQFVSGGFRIPAQPGGWVAWEGLDRLLVSGRDNPELRSPAPVVKRLHRGDDYDASEVAFRGEPTDFGVAIASQGERDPHGKKESRSILLIQTSGDLRRKTWWKVAPSGDITKIDVPSDTGGVLTHSGSYIFRIASDQLFRGKFLAAGTVVASPLDTSATPAKPFDILYRPQRDEVVGDLMWYQANRTSDGILLHVERLGRNKLIALHRRGAKWRSAEVNIPGDGRITIEMADSKGIFVSFENYIQPRTLYEINVGTARAHEVARNANAFDPRPFVQEQWQATSKDGTSIPYFIVRPRNLQFDARHPVVIEGYGAFGASEYPYYQSNLGRLWLQRGGVFVLANVRGGKEGGPDWYVRGSQRQRTYEDAHAIMTDLVRRGVTSPKRIGFMGASAGGLLSGVMLTQFPDLLGAAVIRVPVLDNFRYDLLTGSKSFTEKEYGSPADDRAFLLATSPMQNLRSGTSYPAPLLITATNDDNVWPYQARRFAARMEQLKHPFFFLESAEGGHNGALPGRDTAVLDAIIYTYFQRALEITQVGKADR